MLLLIVLLSYNLVSANLVAAYERTILHNKDISPPTNSLNNVLDPGQNKMVNYDNGTVFTRADADNITTDAMNFLNYQFGLDFLSGFYNATEGSYAIAQGKLYTFGNGFDFLYRLILDSLNPFVGLKNDMFVLDVGYIGFMSGSGLFPGGVMSGKPYYGGNMLAYTMYAYLKESERGKDVPHKIKERIIIRTEVAGINYLNPQGLPEQLIKGVVIDGRGRKGFNTVLVTATQDPDGTIHQRLKSELNFNYTDPYNLNK